jgi:hypothetical protein
MNVLTNLHKRFQRSFRKFALLVAVLAQSPSQEELVTISNQVNLEPEEVAKMWVNWHIHMIQNVYHTPSFRLLSPYFLFKKRPVYYMWLMPMRVYGTYWVWPVY